MDFLKLQILSFIDRLDFYWKYGLIEGYNNTELSWNQMPLIGKMINTINLRKET